MHIAVDIVYLADQVYIRYSLQQSEDLINIMEVLMEVLMVLMEVKQYQGSGLVKDSPNETHFYYSTIIFSGHSWY